MKDVRLGDVCAAMFDQEWYRGRITALISQHEVCLLSIKRFQSIHRFQSIYRSIDKFQSILRFHSIHKFIAKGPVTVGVMWYL